MRGMLAACLNMQHQSKTTYTLQICSQESAVHGAVICMARNAVAIERHHLRRHSQASLGHDRVPRCISSVRHAHMRKITELTMPAPVA